MRMYSAQQLLLSGLMGLVVGTLSGPSIVATLAQPNADGQPDAAVVSRELLSNAVTVESDSAITFSTRQDDGAMNKKMRMSKEGCLLVGQRGPIANIPGTMEISMHHPSRPGSIVMINQHEAQRGVGNTFAYYASGHGQVFLSSSWIGESRRVAQIEKGPLPLGYPSPKYPEMTSAARFEIGARVNDWVSLAAIFEPIADDGQPFVTVDREHPFMDQVDYQPGNGEWINNRRVGRHALLIGTTHNTGASAGGLVLAGDAYHEHSGKGPVIKSPNGTPFRIVVDDDGNLSTQKYR